MARKRLSAEPVVTKLGQIEVLQAQGKTIAVTCKEAGATEQSYYRCRAFIGIRQSPVQLLIISLTSAIGIGLAQCVIGRFVYSSYADL